MTDHRRGGSLQQALNQKLNLDPNAILQEGWNRTKTTYGVLFGSVMLTFLIALAAMLVLTLIGSAMGFGFGEDIEQLQIIVLLVQMLVLPPLFAGLHMLGIGHAIDKKTSFQQLFMFVRQPWPLILVAVVTSLIGQLGGLLGGGVLTMLWLIFFSVSLSMALPLVAEYRLPPFQAVVTSLKVLTRNWFQVFIIYLVLFILTILAILPLGLGLIWMVPMFYNVKGVLYRELFGVYDPGYQPPESSAGSAAGTTKKQGDNFDA